MRREIELNKAIRFIKDEKRYNSSNETSYFLWSYRNNTISKEIFMRLVDYEKHNNVPYTMSPIERFQYYIFGDGVAIETRVPCDSNIALDICVDDNGQVHVYGGVISSLQIQHL